MRRNCGSAETHSWEAADRERAASSSSGDAVEAVGLLHREITVDQHLQQPVRGRCSDPDVLRDQPCAGAVVSLVEESGKLRLVPVAPCPRRPPSRLDTVHL